MKTDRIANLKRRLIKEGVKFVDLKYCTLIGTLNHITVPVERFDEILKEGVGVDGSSLPGYKGYAFIPGFKHLFY